jgi:ferredoxin-NADP reductase
MFQEPSQASVPASPTGAGWIPGTIVERHHETDHAATLHIEMPEPLPFLAGQYVKVRLPVAGYEKPLRRSYSIANAPGTGGACIQITVSRAEPGVVSRALVDDVAIGTEIAVRGPVGTFTRRSPESGADLMIAGGSGIVPIMSMLREQRHTGVGLPTTLLYSARTSDAVIYHDELRSMAQLSWMNFVLTLTRAGDSGAEFLSRRVDGDMLASVLPQSLAGVYICGPAAMVAAVNDALVRVGVEEEQLHLEVFD